ncbi:MarR family transcriptional regulator [Weissella paramesenteroides]|jgi:DNA-binding MarR family transcriptional regulator|uniref:Transcriptional regulator, MarR family n=2 Tax=Weissella paramesenteroides TaxID=1249 RepID=C5R8N4_WEIPA|nr:MarR family transcriptional regulator [Weissella paramesenteroides]ATF40683.1 MarR family transcriptional regulator [Weissella paramesenteroides]EER75528.1 transcriptional regulator, MarR family [Weissella paramesenteroides ATCC 33313]KAA8447297.1 MarR family transcriptional regulator [Weissella paramesenteroides]KAA8451129.1 MarR family transcriptional regulator [Weissella paramesenteroides]MBU7556468.1 MarR family transcriptional regulator [Weissella paramesenteroides]
MPLVAKYINAYLSTIKYLNEMVAVPAAQYDLSFEQYLIMQGIAQHDGLTLTDIVAKRQVTRAAVSRQIRMLLRKQYIWQEADVTDRRRMLLHLTKRGQEVERELTDRIECRFDSWLISLGEERATEILKYMIKFDEKALTKNIMQHY